MSKSTALVMVAVLATGLGSGVSPDSDVPKAETPSLNVTDWTEKTELYMEYPPLVAGRTALLRRSSHEARGLSAADGRPTPNRIHAGEWRCREGGSWVGAVAAGRLPRRRSGAASGTVPLGTRHRGARSCRSPRARRDHGPRRRAIGQRRRREARRAMIRRRSPISRNNSGPTHLPPNRFERWSCDRRFACRPRSNRSRVARRSSPLPPPVGSLPIH